MDVVLHDSNSAINPLAVVHHYQQEDLTALGKLVLALACKSTVSTNYSSNIIFMDDFYVLGCGATWKHFNRPRTREPYLHDGFEEFDYVFAN